MSEFTNLLHYSVASGACVDGNIVERERCSEQMYKAALKIEQSEQELANLDAELTETLMAVADLMDENADLRRQLAEAYERCAQICNRLADESSTTFVRAMSESIEENKMRIARMQGLKTAEEEIRALIPKEADHG